MTLPRVSVVMTTYNAARHLQQALDSLAAQSLQDFEVVVVDDSSTDDTPRILSDFMARDGRFRVVVADRIGRGASLNLAIETARAPLIANLDADDVALPHRLEHQVRFFESDTGLVLLGSTDAVLIDDDGHDLGTVVLPSSDSYLRSQLKRTCQFFHSSTMYRRDAWRAAGRFNERMRCYEDYDLWVRIAPLGRIRNLTEPLSLKRHHDRQTFHARHETNYGYRQRARIMLRHFWTIERDPRTLLRAALFLVMNRRLHHAIWNDRRRANRNADRMLPPRAPEATP